MRERDRRHVSTVEVIIGLVVIAIIVAMAIWFLFFASGGPGPGTV